MKKFSLIVLLLFLVLNLSYSQNLENKYYDITISLPDSMDYVEVSAKLDISNLNTLVANTLKIDLCNGFKGVFFDKLNIFLNDKKLDFTIKEESEVDIKLPKNIESSDKTTIVFNYELHKTSDFENIQYSDFAFQANKNDVHINAAITRTDNWIPKLQDAHSKRLSSFGLTIITPNGYEVMASGKLQSIKEENNKKIFVYKNYDEITDRSLYFFISKNRKLEKIFADDFKLTMYIPEDTLQGNVEYLADIVHKAYRFYEKTYGKTNLNEYKINSFSNKAMPYAGLFNSCCAPQWLFTKPIKNNELYVPVRDLIHEVSHTWWGNIVAPDSGFDYWLFEAFAKFSEPVFLKTMLDYDVEKLYQKRLKIMVASNSDYQPPIKFSHNDDVPQFLKNESAYYKGALFLMSLKQLIGEDDFWKGMQEYIVTNRGKIVNSDNFFVAMQHNTKVNIKEYYYDFVNKSGLSEYAISIKLSKKIGQEYVHSIEIANVSNKELFTNICRNTDMQHDTIYVYIPKGEKKTLEVKSTKPDTTDLIIIDPEDVFLVRKQGIHSPGAKLYTDNNGKLRVTNIVEGSPFQKAGLKNNMIIVSIDGQDISKKDIYEQHRLIQQMKGRKLNIKSLTSENKEIEFVVEY